MMIQNGWAGWGIIGMNNVIKLLPKLVGAIDVFVTSKDILMYIIIVCCCTPIGDVCCPFT